MTDTDHTDDLALLANKPAKAEFLFLNPEKQQEVLTFM